MRSRPARRRGGINETIERGAASVLDRLVAMSGRSARHAAASTTFVAAGLRLFMPFGAIALLAFLV
jgi:hypothetical protein